MATATAQTRAVPGVLAHARLALLLAVEVVAVGLLHVLGDELAVAWTDLPRWLVTTAPADAAVVVLRYLGLAVGWWMAASTGAYLLARAARLPRLAVAAARVTAPAVRRTVDRAIAAGVTASLLAAAPAPVLAAPTAPVPVRVEHHLPGSVVAELGEPGTPAPREPPVTGAPVRPPAVEGELLLPPAVPQAGAHTVRVGEHLWSIAAGVVGEATGRSAAAVSPADVAPYWVRLVDANRERLRSGDPDLIHPGERLVLPPWPGDR